MDNNEALNQIADELHSLNFNMCELIKVLKERNVNTSTSGEITDAEYAAVKEMHEMQMASEMGKLTAERISEDDEYRKRQANLDNVLKNLGVL